MNDRRREIPTWAFINAQIIQDAVKTGKLQSSIEKVEKYYKLKPRSFSIINSAYLTSLLYCLIIVPKELWIINNRHPVFSKISKKDLFSLFKIKKKPPVFEKDPVFMFLRHLRNAISHVRFLIDEEGNFTFWDQKNDDSSQRTFEAITVAPNSMEIFLSTVGSQLANIRAELN